MKRTIFGLVIALALWVGVTIVASTNHRTYSLMEGFGARSLYVDPSPYSASNWTDEKRQGITCLFLGTQSYLQCGLDITMGDGDRSGFDATAYTGVKLSVEYSGKADQFRIYFRNAFKDPSVHADSKFQGIELPIRKGAYSYEIPFDNFEVPSWWSNSVQNKAADILAPDRSNIVHIGFDLESPKPIGQHHFQIIDFSLTAPLLGMNNAGWWLLVTGIYFAIVGFLYNYFRLRVQLKEHSDEMFGLLNKLEVADTESAHFKKLSMYDPLTGLLNRRAAVDLVDEFSRHNSLSGTALVMMDIDHFKKVNDDFGHDLGDEVLQKVGALVKSKLREGDAAVRWGGEEILVICPKTSIEGAKGVAEKLRKEIGQLRFSDESLTITTSCGVAAIALHQKFDQGFKNADEALYYAKNNGRNQVYCAATESSV
ncbi:MAG TPA: GGDEF domain-containing protein [Marinagarivorans sp.]